MSEERTPTPEEKNHTGLIIGIVLVTIVVLLALFVGLYFGLRNKGGDTPDEVNPDPEIVEPGPEDPNSTGDDGEPTHTEHSWVWEHDDEGHWQVCSVCGETTTKNSHTLSYTKGNDTSHTVKCDTCGYEATKEHTLEYVSDGAAGHHQVCTECQYATATVSHDLGSYISDGDNDHYQECSMCDYKSEGNHTWTETSTTPATCTTDGATYYTCELCGATKTTTIPALGHEWSSEWSYDSTSHWHACTRDGCTAKSDETTHTLGERTKNTDGNYYQTCSVCGYSTEPVTPVATYINIAGADSLTIHCNNAADTSTPETLDLRNTITVTVLDQYNNEYTGTYGSEYTLSTTSSEISLNTETGVVTGVSEGTAIVTVTSSANTSLTEDIEIEVIEKEYEAESITASIVDGETNSDGNILLDWGATSGELQVTFTPTYATVQTYEVTPTNDDTGLFTYDETSNTFTHTKLNTGTETFVITATDQSHSASTTITLECDPVIDEPYEVVWKSDPSLPETIAKNESIDNLDDYVEVHYNHTGQDEHEYVDDTYTLSYAGSNGVEIDGTTATFTGDGGTTQYITVTATPSNAPDSYVYAQSSNITITLEIEEIIINCTEYVFNIPQGDNFLGIAVYAEPDDAWPIPEVTWEITSDNVDVDEYLTLEPHANDSTQCAIRTTETTDNLEEGVYIDGITVTAYMDGIAVGTCEIAITTYDFATNSWDLIEKTAAAGEASTYYSVGDTRTITIGEEQHKIRIDGFDHDDLTNTEGNGYNDESYNNGSNKAAITCEMVDCLSETHAMRDSTGNSGGWDQCAMRSYLNSDSGCVLSTIEEELQSIIRVVDKKATKGSMSHETTTSSDSLFLLAYVEFEGTTANEPLNIEGEQYEYWSEHTAASNLIKTVSGTNKSWWLRSPDYTSYAYFWYIEPSGYPMHNKASTENYGVSFAFCI